MSNDYASIEKAAHDLAHSVKIVANAEVTDNKAEAVKKALEAVGGKKDLAAHANFYEKHRLLFKDALTIDKEEKIVLKAESEIAEGLKKIDAAAKEAGKPRADFLDEFLNAQKQLNRLAKSGVEADKELVKQINKASKSLSSNISGLVSAEGWVGAVKKNMLEHDGRPFKMAGRWAAVGLGSVGVLDGVLRGQTSDGEDRSVVTRFGEIALCGGAVAAALLASKAHMRTA